VFILSISSIAHRLFTVRKLELPPPNERNRATDLDREKAALHRFGGWKLAACHQPEDTLAMGKRGSVAQTWQCQSNGTAPPLP
jgi:hypothetical protein